MGMVGAGFSLKVLAIYKPDIDLSDHGHFGCELRTWNRRSRYKWYLYYLRFWHKYW
tara:strand:+ start:1187 stop:1354 length:168 start_codon:yes stop_codon:yes gene_type:complete